MNDWYWCTWDLVDGDVTQLEWGFGRHGEEEEVAALITRSVGCQDALLKQVTELELTLGYLKMKQCHQRHPPSIHIEPVARPGSPIRARAPDSNQKLQTGVAHLDSRFH